MLLCLFFGGVAAFGTVVRGIVRDSLSLEGLPYASVRIVGTPTSAVADSRGIFEVNTAPGARAIQASCQGYAAKTVPLDNSSLQIYDIMLAPASEELAELVIKKKKYSKRNNPAVEFAKRLRGKGRDTDPERNPYYSYDSYQRVSLGLNDFDTTASRLLKSMPFLLEHVDTSEISGRPVLNLSVKEKSATYNYRRSPHAAKTTVHGVKSAGVDEIIEQENVQAILDELLGEVDLYTDDIKLLRNTFVSPLSPIAPDFYRFYLVDSTAVVSGRPGPHIVLAFYPRNKASFGFKGHLYVAAGDPDMHVDRVEMEVADDINLNFVEALKIDQRFDKAPDGSRLKLTDNLFAVMKVLPNTPEVYVARKINFRNHSFAEPDSAQAVFGRLGDTFVEENAANRDSTFWQSARNIDMQAGEGRVDLLMTRLRQKPLFYWSEKILKILVRGYIATGRDSKFDYGPVNTTASYNALEGLRLRAGGYTTANLSPHLFGRGYVAYGFRDKKWKYEAEVEYSFARKHYHAGEFPVHSLRLTHRYDVDRLGSHYLYTNSDNFVLSLTRLSDNRFAYRRTTSLVYTLELPNNFSLSAKVERLREEASEYVRFVDGYGRALGHYDENILSVNLRYAPGEKFMQSRSQRIPLNQFAPVIELSHLWAPRILGSTFGINRTEMSVRKVFSLSLLGQLRTLVSGGHVWGASPFPELFIPNANLSYTIQPGSFALLNPMEFINSSYVAWHLSWHLRGALFNLVPGLRKLKLREVLGFSGLYGHLSDRANPAYNRELPAFPHDAALRGMDKPYMEVSAGLDNIFSILRIDYVWRLNYLDTPYKIHRHGLRVALHFTF